MHDVCCEIAAETSSFDGVHSTDGSPFVSVIIVTYNRCADLEVALESLKEQVGVQLEVVVVDNASTDGTAEFLQRWEGLPLIVYSAPRNLGASVGRNIGIRLSRAPYVAFMDSDARALDPDLIRRLWDALVEDENLAATAPAIYTDFERKEIWVLGGYFGIGGYHDFARSRQEWHDPDYVSTCFSLWRKKALEQVRGFDPAYPYIFEDIELCTRVRDAGWRYRVLPEMAVQHRISQAGRVRPETSFAHYQYTEWVMNRFFVLRLGPWKFLKRTLWWWSREGRRQRHLVYIHYPLTRFQWFYLFVLIPLLSLLAYPRYRIEVTRDYLQLAPIAAGRVTVFGVQTKPRQT